MLNVPVRQTRPDYTYGYGGVGVVPRRGWDAMTARMISAAADQPTDGLRQFYATAPLRLLQVLLSIHPMGRMAMSNNLSLAFCPGDIRLYAVRQVEKTLDDGTVTTTEETDTAETAELESFWNRYPGGLIAFLRTMGRQAEYAGLSCAEAVSGGPLQGVERVYTFDPISLLFEDQPDGSRAMKQFYQLDKALDPATCFVVPVDGDDDNPYGDPLMGAFLAEAVKDLGQEAALSDILRGWAYPHVSIGFPFEEAVIFAKQNADVLVGRGRTEDGKPRNLTPYEYAEEQFEKFCDFLRTLNPDDPLVMPKGSEAKVLDGAGGMAALDPVLKMRRHRMVMGLDQMPSMLGITEGGTQAYAQQQAKTSAKKLEYRRWHALNIALLISNLHLRLRGSKAVARAEADPIQSVDKYVEAQAREVDVRTDIAMVDAGWITPDDAAQKHTGSGAVKSKTGSEPDDDGSDEEREDDQ